MNLIEFMWEVQQRKPKNLKELRTFLHELKVTSYSSDIYKGIVSCWSFEHQSFVGADDSKFFVGN